MLWNRSTARLRGLVATLFFLINCFPALGQQAQIAPDDEQPLLAKAGEPINFTIHLDTPPDRSGGRIMYGLPYLGSARGAVIFSGGANTFCTTTVVGKQDYACSAPTPADVRGDIDGTISDVEVRYPDTTIKMTLKKPINFRVLGLPPIVVKTQTASLIINPTQQQLLRTENAKLQRQVTKLRALVLAAEANSSDRSLAALLRSNIATAVTALQATEREFEAEITDQKFRSDSKIFFSDLQTAYEKALRQVNGSARVAESVTPRFYLAARTSRADSKDYPAAAQVTISAFEQNELAYKIAADSSSFYFDLEVDSTPPGAKVYYFRQGDTPVINQDPTNCTIHSLVLAIWTVRFEKPGYRSEDRIHNPFTDPNHTIHVDLEKN